MQKSNAQDHTTCGWTLCERAKHDRFHAVRFFLHFFSWKLIGIWQSIIGRSFSTQYASSWFCNNFFRMFIYNFFFSLASRPSVNCPPTIAVHVVNVLNANVFCKLSKLEALLDSRVRFILLRLLYSVHIPFCVVERISWNSNRFSLVVLLKFIFGMNWRRSLLTSFSLFGIVFIHWFIT